MLAADCRSLLYLYSTFLTNDLVFPSHHKPTLVIIVVFAARSGANQIHTRKAENITYHVFRYWISPPFTSQQERVAPTSGYIQVASEVACVVESLTRARRENRMQRLVGGRWRAKSLGTPRHDGKTTNSKDLHTYCTCLTSWPRVINYSEKDEGRYLFSVAIPFICLSFRRSGAEKQQRRKKKRSEDGLKNLRSF